MLKRVKWSRNEREAANKKRVRLSEGDCSYYSRNEFPNRRVKINVRDQLFETREETLNKHPRTLLGRKQTREQYYDPLRNAYYFDRDPTCFRHILNYYRHNKLHFTADDQCALAFREELAFFGISVNAVSNCCWDDYRMPKKVRINKVFKMQDPKKSYEYKDNKDKWKKLLWKTFDDPQSSIAAKIIYIISALMIVFGIICTVVETIPTSENNIGCDDLQQQLYNDTNTTTSQECKGTGDKSDDVYFVFESICVGYFTVEYLLRLYTAPKKWSFIKDFMSIIDIASVLPFYVGLFLEAVLTSGSSSEDLNALLVLRILRIFRVFKFSRHSSRLRSLLTAIHRSSSELGFILFSFTLAVILLGSVLFYIEKEFPNTQFDSIPTTMWYCVITMTTTGYGDMVPSTVFGKLIGSVGCLIGVLMIALPVPIIQKKSNLQRGIIDEIDKAEMGNGRPPVDDSESECTSMTDSEM